MRPIKRQISSHLYLATYITLVVGQTLVHLPVSAQPSKGGGIPVTADNFTRAETDAYFANIVKQAGGTGKFFHRRELEPIDKQIVIRANRDTVYSAGVFDLDAGPVTVTLPKAGKRFRSMIVITQDQYIPAVVYNAGRYTYDRKTIGTRYVMLALRPWSIQMTRKISRECMLCRIERRSNNPAARAGWKYPIGIR